MTLKQLCFSFKGRINRRIFWVCSAAITLTILTCWLLAILTDGYGGSVTALIVFFTFPILAALFVGIPVTVKRLHDINRSGKNALMVLIPFIGLVYLLFACGLLKGTDGENDYGPPVDKIT